MDESLICLIHELHFDLLGHTQDEILKSGFR